MKIFLTLYGITVLVNVWFKLATEFVRSKKWGTTKYWRKRDLQNFSLTTDQESLKDHSLNHGAWAGVHSHSSPSLNQRAAEHSNYETRSENEILASRRQDAFHFNKILEAVLVQFLSIYISFSSFLFIKTQ